MHESGAHRCIPAHPRQPSAAQHQEEVHPWIHDRDQDAQVASAYHGPMPAMDPHKPMNPSAEASDTVFTARALGKTYQMGEVQVKALQDVDLDIKRGEFIVLLGPSGSGKSTLLNILGGLDRPSSGSARFAEHELSGASDADLTRYRREHVGFVFQFYNLIPSLTVRENVELVTDIAHNPMPAAEALRLLQGAFQVRPDAEIAAHLGEVLWTMGQRNQASAIWKEGVGLNPQNETLMETIRRLRGKP